MNKKRIKAKLVRLAKSIKTKRAYMKHLFRERDYHGIMDAAADIRELEAESRVFSMWSQNIW